jgi:hypothetical protein
MLELLLAVSWARDTMDGDGETCHPNVATYIHLTTKQGMSA